MSSSLGAVTAVTWEDMLKWYFGKYSNATQTIINKVISEEFESFYVTCFSGVIFPQLQFCQNMYI